MTPVNGEKIYRFRVASGVYGPQEDDQLNHPSTQQLTGGNALPGFPGLDQHNMWKQANNDSITGKYKLLSQTLTFVFEGSTSSSCKIGIYFVKPNPRRMFRVLTNTTAADGVNFMLPDSLGSFNNLLGDYNSINPMYFKQTRKPMFFRLAPSDNLSTQEVRRTITLTHNKVLNIHPISQDGMTPNAAGYQQISLLNQEWVVICTDCDDTVAVANQPKLKIKRIARWRDLDGSAS